MDLSVSQVASKIGVSRQRLHSWLARYEAEGLDGLADRSHRPVETTRSKSRPRGRGYCAVLSALAEGKVSIPVSLSR